MHLNKWKIKEIPTTISKVFLRLRYVPTYRIFAFRRANAFCLPGAVALAFCVMFALLIFATVCKQEIGVTL